MPYNKTNWTETTGVTAARLSNMEKQYEEAIKDAVPQSYDGRTQEVFITAGAGQQYGTIQAAVDSLKKFNAGKRTINVLAGHTEPGSLNIIGFHGGDITIQLQSAGNINVNGKVNITDNTAHITIAYTNIVADPAVINAYFDCARNSYVMLNNCKNNVGSSYGARAVFGGTYYITNCQFSNHVMGIDAQIASTLMLEMVSGSGNSSTGINSNGAIVLKGVGTTLTGATPEVKSNGGQIF